MRVNSVRARLILGAAIWVSVGISISGIILSHLYRQSVIAHFDHELQDHVAELASMIGIDSNGVPAPLREISDPRFNPPRSGMYWQMRFNGATSRSPSLENFDLPMIDAGAVVKPVRVATTLGPMRLVQQQVRWTQLQKSVRIGVGVEERLIEEAMYDFQLMLALSLGILSLGLVGAAYAQVEFGLRPLARIRRALNAVRSNEVERLPDDLPVEVSPLVTDLNTLIAANRDMVRRARLQAANFAHALKTPLTILMDEGRELAKAGQRNAANVILQQCIRMQRQIDYQTARARTSARANPGAVERIGPAIRTITGALMRLDRNRSIAFEIAGNEEAVVACDPQDLSEMLGNVIDNAAKWGRSRVRITIRPVADAVRISIEDDGPGIPSEHFEAVFSVGHRLDESIPGSGLGLAITRDLATLYDGRIWIERSELGGVAIHLELPSCPGST